MGWARRFAPAVALALGGVLAAQGWGQSSAVRVKVSQVDSLGHTLAAEAYVYTDEAFTSVEAPERAGWRFTHWTVSPEQPGFANRDAWGRALDAVTVTPKDAEVTLTAVYADAEMDSDGDGVADAEERYWYGEPGGYDTAGTLEWDGASDTDGDGYTFAEELQAGMNPLFPNRLVLGGVATGDSDAVLYNPNGYLPYTVRSEPEGELFATYSGYVRPGTVITTKESFAPSTSTFAYWTVNGVRQADDWGVATNTATFTVGNEPIEVVAWCVADEQTRQARYWYGKDAGPDSDTDGDGYTFAEELQAGTNPIFPNRLVLGGVATGDSDVLLYNPKEYPEITIRSEPEGIFATEQVVLRPGQSHTTAAFSPDDRFAQWTRNGVRQADAWGRALDAVTIVGNPGVGKVDLVAHFVDDAHTRLSCYWYGVDDQPEDSDTDGDGYSFAEELQYGLNPLFPNVLQLGGVAHGDSPVVETNLQLFDMGSQALVKDAQEELALEELFATLDGATGDLVGGMDFAGPVSVAVVDVDADDNFDFLVYDGTLRLFHNIGTPGSPEWEITDVTQVKTTGAGEPQIAQIDADLGSATADGTASVNGLQTLQDTLAQLARPVMAGGETENGPAVWFCDDGGAVSRYDLATGEIVETGLTGFPVWDETDGLGVFANNTLTLGDQTLTLDAAVEAPCAAALADATGDGTADLLVADTSGRVALYARTAEGFALEHRVWGGSFDGFAEGLTLAPVDWEADGDLDMLCGTADGKLLLLSDPNVGKPSNLRATAGYDNVLLTWDPNGQSRVYGYGVYRAEAAGFARIAEPSLPTYRDTPPSLAEWAYRVTALSRLWTAGNSEPETFESLPSDVVRVNLGGVTLWMPETLTAYANADLALPVTVDNSKGLGAFTLTLTYDPAFVEPLGVETTALTEGLTLTSEASDGTWTLTAKGTLPAGSGPLFRLRFHIRAGVLGETAFRLMQAVFTAADGKPVATNALPIETQLTVIAPPVPARVTLAMEDAEAKTGERIRVPVAVTADTPIVWDTLTLTPAYDASKLRLVSREEATEDAPTLILIFEVLEQHGDDLFATVTVDGTATGANGLPATVVPATATIAIEDSNPPVPAMVTLTATDVEAETLSQVTVEVSVTSDSPIDWESLTLTPEFDAGKLSLVAQTPATEGRPATFIFEVLEQHGDNLFATVTVSGTATGANGLPATVLPATATITITDSNPPVPAVVTLTATDTEAETLSQVTVEVSVASDSTIDWETLALTPAFDAGKLSLVSQTPATEGRPAIFTFEVLEQHGDNLFATVTVSGTATSANGLPATVLPATATITITDSNPPVPAIVTLTTADVPASVGETVTVSVAARSKGDLLWETLTLTPDFDSAWLELVCQTPATASTPATFTFRVLERFGVNLATSITFSGTAMSANGLAATVGSVTSRVLIADNPQEPAVVSLSLPNQTVDTLSRVSLTVEATAVGEVDWSTLVLHAQWDASKLDLVSQEGRTFVFDVKDLHEDLSTTVTIRGTATSANGLPAIVQPATCTLTFIDTNPPKPAKVSLRTKKTLTAMTEETLAVSVEVVVLEGELDWASLTLTADSEGNGKLTQQGQPTKATAESPIVTFTFDVPEQHGDGLAATLSFTGTATSANGLPAIVQPATCTLTFIDTNPPKPAKVSLRTKKTLTAMTEETLSVSVEVVVLEGELDWESLTLTADSEGNGKLMQQGQPTKATAESPIVTFTFDVPEQHGDGLAATLTFTGAAMSANGLPAIVQPATCTLTLIDTNPPIPAKVALRTEKTFSAMTESELAVTVEVAVTEGELDWESLTLNVDVGGSGALRLRGQTKPTAENPKAIFTFDVPEQHGDNLVANLTFSGTAMSANGLKKAEITPATCTVTLTDANPPQPAKVTLSAQGGNAQTEHEVKISVRVNVDGELDWGSLALTAKVTEGLLELRKQTKPTAGNPVATFTFWVPEQHGDDLSAAIVFSGTATSANGLAAQVKPTTVHLAITDSNPPQDPTVVPPWTKGDTDGDGKLTWVDYQVAREAIWTHHRPGVFSKPHSADVNAADNKIHRSICQALDRGENGTLALEDIGGFQQYLEGILGIMPEEVTR